MARTELRMGLEALLGKFDRLRLTRGEQGVVWLESFIAHGPSKLLITAGG